MTHRSPPLAGPAADESDELDESSDDEDDDDESSDPAAAQNFDMVGLVLRLRRCRADAALLRVLGAGAMLTRSRTSDGPAPRLAMFYVRAALCGSRGRRRSAVRRSYVGAK